jgi:hypothetical protein
MLTPEQAECAVFGHNLRFDQHGKIKCSHCGTVTIDITRDVQTDTYVMRVEGDKHLYKCPGSLAHDELMFDIIRQEEI